jgi:hypothetical protein
MIFSFLSEHLIWTNKFYAILGSVTLTSVSMKRDLPWIVSGLWAFRCTKQRQARELISVPNLATGARILSFNTTQSRVVIGLLTGHNTLKRHLHVMGLGNNPICRKCGTEEENSVHILCECEVLDSLRYTYMGSFFLDPEGIRVLGMGVIWNFAKGTGFL